MDMTCQVVDVTFLLLQVCKSNKASEAIAGSNRRRRLATADADTAIVCDSDRFANGSQCSALEGDGSVPLAPEVFESFIARVCSPEFSTCAQDNRRVLASCLAMDVEADIDCSLSCCA